MIQFYDWHTSQKVAFYNWHREWFIEPILGSAGDKEVCDIEVRSNNRILNF